MLLDKFQSSEYITLLCSCPYSIILYYTYPHRGIDGKKVVFFSKLIPFARFIFIIGLLQFVRLTYFLSWVSSFYYIPNSSFVPISSRSRPLSASFPLPPHILRFFPWFFLPKCQLLALLLDNPWALYCSIFHCIKPTVEFSQIISRLRSRRKTNDVILYSKVNVVRSKGICNKQ